MNNIFENAKFGDKFLTRDGRVAIFYDFSPDKKVCRLLYKGEGLMENYTDDGSFYHNLRVDNFDIVSRYEEPVDILAIKYAKKKYNGFFNVDDSIWNETIKDFTSGYNSAFNNKAMEE